MLPFLSQEKGSHFFYGVLICLAVAWFFSVITGMIVAVVVSIVMEIIAEIARKKTPDIVNVIMAFFGSLMIFLAAKLMRYGDVRTCPSMLLSYGLNMIKTTTKLNILNPF